MRCIRNILGISWKDRVTNERVLEIAKLPSLFALLKQRRLRWLGHVHRMQPSRLPRRVLLGAIADAKRSVGRPMLRNKDCAKRDMHAFNIPVHQWEKLAEDRDKWRKLVSVGSKIHDDAWFKTLAKPPTTTATSSTTEATMKEPSGSSGDYPPTCPKNEEYYDCTNGCTAWKCSELGFPLDCDKCTPGCVCKDGLVRADDGTCIPANGCPSCGGDKNAQQGCGSNCNKMCSDIGKPPKPCPPSCIFNGCTCRELYYYDANEKKCVKPEDCTLTCPANEEYSPCIQSGCTAKNCSQLGKPVPCIRIDPKYCIKGCVCKEGYFRNAKENCVPEDQCKTLTCPANEEYSPCIQSGCTAKNCSQLGKPVPCIRIDPKYCIKGCVCKEGYFRNAKENCVPEDQCKTLTCPANEEYSPCIQSGCTAKNCSQLGKPVPCIRIDPKYCIKGCVCKQGYFRNAKENCVPEDQCKTQPCPANEEYSSCINGGCGPRNCSQIGKPSSCVHPVKCIEGCVCKQGWLRAGNGTCVPRDQCRTKCGLNEIYSDCPNPCPPRKCNLKDAVFKCKAPPQLGDPECKPGCTCAKNYYRNATGSCVLKKNCEKPLKCPENEQYDPCPMVCPPQKCGVNPAVILCRRNPEYGDPNCEPGCICKDEEVRNDAGQCVPKDKCPKCTGQNEYWEPCIQGCSNQTCGSIGQKYYCPFQKGCKNDCRCKPGFYRKDVGSPCSLTEEQCTKGKCPTGEKWNTCPAIKCDADYCAKNKDSPKQCPIGIVCDPPRCTCEINEKRDRKTGKCIPVADCPPFPCPRNEEYRVCPPPCPGESCFAYIVGPLVGHCPPNEPGTICIPQCRCYKGYSRNDNGTCIPSKDCKTTPTTTVKPPTTSTGVRGSGLSGVLDGITAFTGKCLYERMQSAPNENIIMSAMSVFTPIAELCLYSDGPAFDQCIEILNLKDKQDIRDTFTNFSSLYEGVTSVNFSTAAKVYPSDKYQLSDGFKKDVVDVFRAETQEIDFIKKIQAAAIMNAWVESKTNNKIKDLVSPDMLNEMTRMVLINAIYFKGKWQKQFNENNTKEEDFYLGDGSTTKTKLMYQEIKDLEYGEDASLDCKVVRIPYTGEESSAIIVLPNSINGTMQLAKYLQLPANWKKLLDSLSPQKVQLYLPKFVISTTTDLKDLLKKANITNWFDCGNSGLSGLLAKPEDICMTEAIQKAWCEVNEIGTEATAANAVVITRKSPSIEPRKLIFRADHGFLYHILMKDQIMFSGAVRTTP
ncbi:zonadhesin-like [Cydia strobilella]|uniref:zonadhesin-like n=1 Tax=Cydia strobilella TaxID=1100964 RepID=UPI003007AF4D